MDSTALRRRKHTKKPVECEAIKTVKSEPTFTPFPTQFGFIIPVTMIVVIKLMLYWDSCLPEQVLLRDEPYQRERFIGEQAQLYLNGLVGNGNPRVTGSYDNEVIAVRYIQSMVESIVLKANPIHKIEYELQQPTGRYYLAYNPYGFQNIYDQVKNFVVRLSSEQDSGSSVLVNCHFDTAPESPGASDGGIFCAIQLEILRKLTQRDQPLKHNVIFLFNGAEEPLLQASHGFIAHHRWAKECKVFVNLDSGGVGGRELLFQTSSQQPWLVELYGQVVPYPSGNVIADDLFHKGFLQGDSDFRVFRDFGPIPGYDFAYYDHPNIYHTKLDRMDVILPGVYQHTGDNMLELVQALAEAPQLSELNNTAVDNKNELIYYDILGTYLVVYSLEFSVFLHLAAILLSTMSIYGSILLMPNNNPVSSFITSCTIQLSNWSLTTAVLHIFAQLLDLFHSTMGWNHYRWFLFTLYGLPLLYCGITIPHKLFKNFQTKTSRDEIVLRYLTAVQFLFTVALAVTTYLQIRSFFMIVFFVAFPAVINVGLQLTRRYNVQSAIIAYVVSSFLPISYILYIIAKSVSYFASASTRLGVFMNPEYTIATIVSMLGVLATGYLTPLFLLFKNPQKISTSLFFISIATLAVILKSPICFPYTSETAQPVLQRFYALHTQRTFYNVSGEVRRYETGFWVTSMDRNDIQYISQSIPELNEGTAVTQDCIDELYCGLPAYSPRMGRDSPYSHWLPGPAPKILNPTNITIISSEIFDGTKRISFNATGADHMIVVLSPRPGVELIKWSFDDSTPVKGKPWGDRPTYMMQYTCGCEYGVFNFTIDLKVPSGVTENVIDVAIAGHYMHHKNIWTEEYNKFLEQFPDWTNIYRWIATYSSHVF